MMVDLTYLEFYAGIGGWGYALEFALRNVASHRLKPKLLGAFDHSDLCKTVFNHNHDNKKLFRQTPIEKITQKQLETLSAHIWCMSPPCQPHTRQHSNQQCELDDPRSKSFLHLCDMIGAMEESTLPCLILLENVVGFELSGTEIQTCEESGPDQQQQQKRRGSFQIWREVLSRRGYRNAHFHLDPNDVGIPNTRPRHYTVAFRPGSLHSKVKDATMSAQLNYVGTLANLFTRETLDKPPIIHGPESLGGTPNTLPRIGEYLDADCKIEPSLLRIPEKVWSSSSAWCFDVITPLHHRSACFTHSYAKFVRGSGSILYTGPLDSESNNSDEAVKTNRKRDRATAFLTSTIFNLEAPDGRSFDADWSKDIDWVKEMRYLSGTEIARLMGFPVAGKSASTGDDAIGKSFREFNFPATVTVKQQWKLLGNSLNVKVAGKVAEIGMTVLFTQ